MSSRNAPPTNVSYVNWFLSVILLRCSLNWTNNWLKFFIQWTPKGDNFHNTVKTLRLQGNLIMNQGTWKRFQTFGAEGGRGICNIVQTLTGMEQIILIRCCMLLQAGKQPPTCGRYRTRDTIIDWHRHTYTLTREVYDGLVIHLKNGFE